MPLEVNIDVFLMVLDKLFFVVVFFFFFFCFFVVVFFFNPKILIFFLISLQKNICCGYSLEVPQFHGENKKNIYLIPTLILTYVFYYFEIVD